jgi:hypothetical protein
MAAEIGLGSVSTVFTYFNPTRSPYYTIGLAACAGIFYSCDVTRGSLWPWLFVPAYLVAALTLLLSIDSRNNLTKAEHEDQLRFARSACISVAVLALTFAGRAIAGGDSNKALSSNEMLDFKLNIVTCCIQIFVFLVYNWALNKQDLPTADRNYVQITLLTSAFLADTSLNMAYANEGDATVAGHHQTAAYALGALWVLCIVFWVTKLVKLRIIQIQRLEPVEQGSRERAEGSGPGPGPV